MRISQYWFRISCEEKSSSTFFFGSIYSNSLFIIQCEHINRAKTERCKTFSYLVTLFFLHPFVSNLNLIKKIPHSNTSVAIRLSSSFSIYECRHSPQEKLKENGKEKREKKWQLKCVTLRIVLMHQIWIVLKMNGRNGRYERKWKKKIVFRKFSKTITVFRYLLHLQSHYYYHVDSLDLFFLFCKILVNQVVFFPLFFWIFFFKLINKMKLYINILS